MNKNVTKVALGCIVGVAVLTASPLSVNAAATAGISNVLSAKAQENKESQPAIAGASLAISSYVSSSQTNQEQTAEKEEAKNKEKVKSKEEKSPYEDLGIAQVNNYVNVRSEASENGEVVGKMYNDAAGKIVETQGDWYKIESGSVVGYVKSQYLVRDNKELAESVQKTIATVKADSLRVRSEANTEADVLKQLPQGEKIDVVGEQNGWVEVATDSGNGYVSSDYVATETVYKNAESKAEEEARIAKEKEEAEQKKAEEEQQAAVAAASKGQEVVNFASQFLGNPYVWGGTSLTNGADCSGFVLAVYANFGVSLPHSSGALAGVGYGVSPDAMQPGDIVCYSGHVGIYVGGGMMINASTPATGIKYTSVGYRPIVAVRRIF